jgi:phosphoribosyl 1,2-cyclic phosphodiesterase
VQVRFWGTRGSIASPGPGTVRYGGNTACVEIRSASGVLLVLDCGTGARRLGKDLVEQSRHTHVPPSGCLLIGHTHWDHIQGLPFFAPLFEDGSVWDVYGPRGLGESIGQTLAGQMQYQYFPVSHEQLVAHVSFHDLLEGSFEIGDLRITAQYLNHPALTLGYRIEGDGVSVVYACDHEPYDPSLVGGGGDVSASRGDSRHAQFMHGADLVIHDSQYRPDEYLYKKGWGHSTVEYAVAVAAAAQVGTLVLFHHDPDHDDAAVDEMLKTARRHAGDAVTVLAAAEGMVLDVTPRAEPAQHPAQSNWRATYQPKTTELSAFIVLAAADPALRAAILRAAAEEHLHVLDLDDDDEPDVNRNALVVVDHDDALSTQAARLHTWGERAVLALTRDRPMTDTTVQDWLVWPSSIGHIRTKLRAAVLRRACQWQGAPLPADEEQRLDSLHSLKLLDTPDEERFDRYTREACATLHVPIATVTLVDADRQWFKSRHGLDIHETPRDQSVCAHAILEDDVMQVPDLQDDPRFADNPVVSGPLGLRFYAGAPLVLSDGSRIGTLCIGDVEPRVLDAGELGQLRRLADGVRAQLEAGVEVAHS